MKKCAMATPTCNSPSAHGSNSTRPDGLRKAELSDIPAIEALIDASVRGLATTDYTPDQIDAALRTAFSVDTQLIDDGTYFVVERDGQLAACGGWSYRKTLCGGSHHAVRDAAPMDPAVEAAKIRAIFVHPNWARQGFGRLLLRAAEEAAMAAGFHRFEMGATLTGVPLYLREGYQIVERIEIPLERGLLLPVVRMEKTATSELPHSV